MINYLLLYNHMNTYGQKGPLSADVAPALLCGACE